MYQLYFDQIVLIHLRLILIRVFLERKKFIYENQSEIKDLPNISVIITLIY